MRVNTDQAKKSQSPVAVPPPLSTNKTRIDCCAQYQFQIERHLGFCKHYGRHLHAASQTFPIPAEKERESSWP